MVKNFENLQNIVYKIKIKDLENKKNFDRVLEKGIIIQKVDSNL